LGVSRCVVKHFVGGSASLPASTGHCALSAPRLRFISPPHMQLVAVLHVKRNPPLPSEA
jgi:hypothetical protein